MSIYVQYILFKSHGKSTPLSVNFVYAGKNYSTSTKLTLCGAPFPSVCGKLFLLLQHCIIIHIVVRAELSVSFSLKSLDIESNIYLYCNYIVKVTT
jgi:hypothetical protein